MSTADTPAVARHRVRLALRSAREAKQLTQSQVADAMDWSLSKVMRIEKGDVNVSLSDLRSLLAYLEVTDPAEVRLLIDDARTARSERWSADPAYREHLPTALQQLMQFEQEATAIRHYGSVIVPGVLQTAEYADAIFRSYEDELDEATIKTRVEARLSRRSQVLNRPDPPLYLLMIDESVLFREVGGPIVMADQLRTILRLVAETSILVRVVPFVAAASIALLGPFTLLDLGSDQNSILYRESYLVDEIVHTRRTLARHRTVFEQLWAVALDDQASAQLIEERAAAMIASTGGG
jgi:transcriptional regulator with XRE-family HTH domain